MFWQLNEKLLHNEFYTKYNEKDLMAKARVISAKTIEQSSACI